MSELIGRYPNLETVVWAQEEPTNMGPWRPLRHRLESAVDAPGPPCSSPGARGARARPRAITRAHAEEQLRISSVALGLD